MTKAELTKAEKTVSYTGYKCAHKEDGSHDYIIVVINHAGFVVGEFSDLKDFSKAMVRRRQSVRRQERKEKRIIRQL